MSGHAGREPWEWRGTSDAGVAEACAALAIGEVASLALRRDLANLSPRLAAAEAAAAEVIAAAMRTAAGDPDGLAAARAHLRAVRGAARDPSSPVAVR